MEGRERDGKGWNYYDNRKKKRRTDHSDESNGNAPRKAAEQSASQPLEKSTPTARSLCGLVTAFRASKHAQVPITFVALVFGNHVALCRPSWKCRDDRKSRKEKGKKWDRR